MTAAKKQYKPIDLSGVTRYSITKRANKTATSDFGKPLKPSASATDFFDSLPKLLKAEDLKAFIREVMKARKKNLPFHLLIGAHTIKVGLSPIFIDLMKRGIVTGLTFNGAGVIHDLELAFFGGTSEDVQKGLIDGSFGMVRETGELYAEAVALTSQLDIGLGEACGMLINKRKAKNRNLSVFAVAQKLGLPVTIHVGIGTDIVAQHPSFDGAAVGQASHIDFKILCDICTRINRGGVAANIGSAVILPEVFLKALTVARNMSKAKSRLTTANFDMLDHYRPRENILSRPTFQAGTGYSFTGHHELMVPILAWGLKLAASGKKI